MIHHIKIILSILIFFSVSFAQQSEISVMPMPKKVELSGEKFLLDSTFTVKTDMHIERLFAASTRFLRRLSGYTGLFFSQDFITKETNSQAASLEISVKGKGKLQLGVDESYKITITENTINLTAQTDIAAMRGLETLLQLLAVDKRRYYFPAGTIEDVPRFPWRGLMIDASRHFMPLEVIKRNLDGMAAVKLNVLHWHLSDDQGFRVESKVYPNLQLKGSDGFYYTQEQIKKVISYAENRGIRVIPEFDVPGHVTAMVVAYPELGSGSNPQQVERKWGIKYPALNPASEYTYTFLDNLFGEMAALFPDKYFHIGGDEVKLGKHHKDAPWSTNKEILAFMKENNLKDGPALQAHFNSRLLSILTKHGKIMIGWDEILHEAMPKNVVIQSWRGKTYMEKAAKEGFQSILSNGYYIDLIYPTTDHYLNDPLPENSQLTDEQKKLILGGEATMWAEYISPETIDSRIWPRTAAIAERFWSEGSVKDTSDMYRRLDKMNYRLEEHGLNHIKNHEMMLRRLTNNQNTDPLETLIEVIEPVKRYNRGRGRPYTSYSPLTRVVDAARPDAKIAREFRDLVNHFLNESKREGEKKEQLVFLLEKWSTNHDRLLPIIYSSPILNEVESLSMDLSKISKIGLQAISLIDAGHSMSKSETEENSAIIKNARKVRAQVELMICSAIENLLTAASSTK